MSTRAQQTREALWRATATFLEVGKTITPEQWDMPATEAWSVRELFAHTTRAYSTIEQYLALEPVGIELASASSYFSAALVGGSGIHDFIIERGKAAAVELGEHPLLTASALCARVLERVAITSDDAIINHAAGTMRFAVYLETRVTEVVLHTFDLEDALGIASLGAEQPVELVTSIMLELTDRVEAASLLRALTGRSNGRGCNVLG